MNCASNNLIYCITWNGCNSQYIGQTVDKVRNRVRVHKQQIAHKEFRMLGMSEHISVCGKNKTPDFYITPFYKVKRDSETEKDYEGSFHKKFKPKLKQSFSFKQ